MLKKIYELKDLNERKVINSKINQKTRLIMATQAVIISILFTSIFHAITINMMILMVLYKSIGLLITLFVFIFFIMMTLSYAEDIYYVLLNKKNLIDSSIDIKSFRINGFKQNIILGTALSLVLSIITYVILILI
ncbi:hypothetical protein KHQ82_07700 [Mycoplasmatota bacterium]|nr:hypothetical protein KHQ82_07700 [Mycoplasmatota bacterium]